MGLVARYPELLSPAGATARARERAERILAQLTPEDAAVLRTITADEVARELADLEAHSHPVYPAGV